MKKKLMKRILAVAVIATFFVANFAFAKETEPIPEEPMEVIQAENIGIETMDHRGEATEMVETVNEDAEIDTENPIVDESPVYEEEDYEEPVDEEPTEVLKEEMEPVEEETDEPPAGKVEGYIAGVYLVPNSSCDLHSECYKCEECTIERTLSYDEEQDMYIGEEYCTVCGHGTCVEIADEELEDYAPVVEEEESEE